MNFQPGNPYESPQERDYQQPTKWKISQVVSSVVICCALVFLAVSFINTIVLWILGS